jgi:hypothetical protein
MADIGRPPDIPDAGRAPTRPGVKPFRVTHASHQASRKTLRLSGRCVSRSNFASDIGVLGMRDALSLSHDECIEESETETSEETVMRNHFFAATLFACALLQIAMIAGVLIR